MASLGESRVAMARDFRENTQARVGISLLGLSALFALVLVILHLL